MKIGIVTTWMAKCGIGTYSAFLGEELQKQGLDVVILAEKKDVLPKGFDPNFPSKLTFVECWSRNEPFDELLETIKKENLDAVHIQHQFGLFPYEYNLTNFLRELIKENLKIVITLHDVIPYDANMSSYFENIIKYADEIIVHTSLCKQLLITQWKCPENKIRLIYHGTKIIEVPSKEESRKQLGLPQNSTIILSWGFIWESKGILELVEILAQLLKENPNTILIHAGGVHPVFDRKDYLKNILKTAFKLGIRPNNFIITGFLDEEKLKLYFGSCDLIVLNYMRGSASASGAAHRALSSHRPILGTDDPCIMEIPKYEVMRFDKQSMLRGIQTVLGDEKLQKELVEKEERFAEETSWKNIASSHISVYGNA